MKHFDPPKLLGSGSAFRSNMIATIISDPNTHLELSGPFFELITIFESFCQKS